MPVARRLLQASAAAAGLTAACLPGGSLPSIAAFSRDFHASTTFAAALATGWSWGDAEIIAASDYAMDENETTVASWEETPDHAWIHNSAKSYRFHCFSQSGDSSTSAANKIAGDVERVLSGWADNVHRAIAAAKAGGVNRGVRVDALAAMGVLLHCQQDSWAHSGYGGSVGHAFATRSPDDTAARPEKTREALRESLDLLGRFRTELDGAAAGQFSADRLRAAIVDPRTLPSHWSYKSVDIGCVSGLAGRWLALTMLDQNRRGAVPDDAWAAFAIDGSTDCDRVFHDALTTAYGRSADIVLEPPFLYPVLSGDARPSVGAGGAYLTTVGEGRFDHGIVRGTAVVSVVQAGCRYRVAVTIENSGPDTAPAAHVVVGIGTPDPDGRIPAASRDIPPLPSNTTTTVDVPIDRTLPCAPADQVVGFVAEIQPPLNFSDGRWNDRSMSNNDWQGVVAPAPGISNVAQ